MTKLLAPFAVAALLLSAPGCSSRQAGSDETRGADVRSFDVLVDEMVNGPGVTEAPLYASAVEATPGTRFVVDGVDRGPASDLLVVGTVADVRAGRTFGWPNGPQVAGGESTREEYTFNDPKGAISTLVVEISTDQVRPRGAKLPADGVVTIELSFLSPIDVEGLSDELMGRRVVGILQSNEKTPFDLDPTHYGVLHLGAFLGFVDDDEIVTFGFADPEGGPEKVALSDLLNPPAVIKLKMIDGTPVRDGAQPDTTPSTSDEPPPTMSPEDTPAATVAG